MVFRGSTIVVLILICISNLEGTSRNRNDNIFNSNGVGKENAGKPNATAERTYEYPILSEEALEEALSEPMTFHLRHRQTYEEKTVFKDLIEETKIRDLTRIGNLRRRIVEKKNQNIIKRLKKDLDKAKQQESHSGGTLGHLMATLESGFSHGSGEYFIDVHVGTPPKHFSLILDTGSDLSWIQCVPCDDCLMQKGPFFDPKESSSYRNISCLDARCQLVESPDDAPLCQSENQSCPYIFWYGDSSKTTGDFALEAFRLNFSRGAGKSKSKKLENVMFGCGHRNKGHFHGAAGLLGLGKGPLSFASQLQSLYGHSFSYCLVSRYTDASENSKLIIGKDKDLLRNPDLNFTSFVGEKEYPDNTFYYVQIKSIVVGEEVLKIPEETWALQPDGTGGTVIDSGTALSYFPEHAYKMIKDAFVSNAKDYPMVDSEDLKILEPCFNVSGAEKLELPGFQILFADGAVWNFPVENCFLRPTAENIVCLAIQGTPSSMSIIGNFQQQNFHILYDAKRSRLGYAPVNCADI